jgi:hypothetical protein
MLQVIFDLSCQTWSWLDPIQGLGRQPAILRGEHAGLPQLCVELVRRASLLVYVDILHGYKILFTF